MKARYSKEIIEIKTVELEVDDRANNISTDPEFGLADKIVDVLIEMLRGKSRWHYNDKLYCNDQFDVCDAVEMFNNYYKIADEIIKTISTTGVKVKN